MDKELLAQAEKDLQELKEKVPAELSALVSSQSTTVKVLISICESQAKQIESQSQLIATQTQQIADLTDAVHSLQETIKELQRQIGQNSQNSSKPPSSDGYKKPNKKRSLREKSGRKPGGQKGHKGANLSLPHAPDEVKKHIPAKCQGCEHYSECVKSQNVFECAESRFVIEAVVTTKVVEHQTLKVRDCPCCSDAHNLRGEFPQNVKACIQYGDSFTVLSGLLSTYGAVSLERIHVLLGSLFGISLSPATVSAMVSKCAKSVKPIMDKVLELLKKAKVGHFDETGVRALGKLYWVHNSSTEDYTYQSLNEKRGEAGIRDNGVIPDFKGVSVHDCWGPYWKFNNVTHAVCCAHILRELNGVMENAKEHKWAANFKKMLTDMLIAKKDAIQKGLQKLEDKVIAEFERKYDEIISSAHSECPPPPPPDEKKRGRVKKGKERSLIERLQKLKDSVCLFIKNFDVPFDNNQAERDVRNVKTKSKVSGCFRSKEGAENYLTVMSFLSTGNKHGISAFDALTAAFAGNGEIVLGDAGSE